MQAGPIPLRISSVESLALSLGARIRSFNASRTNSNGSESLENTWSGDHGGHYYLVQTYEHGMLGPTPRHLRDTLKSSTFLRNLIRFPPKTHMFSPIFPLTSRQRLGKKDWPGTRTAGHGGVRARIHRPAPLGATMHRGIFGAGRILPADHEKQTSAPLRTSFGKENMKH